MACCSALNCSNSTKKNPELSFFYFPKKPANCKKWIINTRRLDLQNVSPTYANKNLRLCANHFEDSQFFSILKRNRLERDAVPTLFSGITNEPPKIKMKRSLPQRNHDLPPKKPRKRRKFKIQDDDLPELFNPEPTLQADNNSHEVTIEDDVNDEFLEGSSTSEPTQPATDYDDLLKESQKESLRLKIDLKKSKRIIRNKNKKIKELSDKVKCLNDRLGSEDRSRLSGTLAKEEVIEFIDKNFDAGTALLLSTQVRLMGRAKRGERFTDKDKELALSIYYQSPKCYKFLRKYLHLPSKSTLERWIKNIKVKPGISDFVLNAMHRKIGSMSDKEKVCTLILDEVKLSPGLQYDRHNDLINGFEDFGVEGRTEHGADHALVFMLRGIETGWKQSIGHFYCRNSTNGSVLKNLLFDALGKKTDYTQHTQDHTMYTLRFLNLYIWLLDVTTHYPCVR